MGIKSYKPTSPARRFYSVSDFKEITKGVEPEQSLARAPDAAPAVATTTAASPAASAAAATSSATASSTGARQDRHPGEGRDDRVRPEPHGAHRAPALRRRREALHPRARRPDVGDTIVSSRNADIKPGNAMTLRYIPLGTTIHNIEMKKGKGGQLVRSAGSGAQLMAKDGDYAQVRLPVGRGPQGPPRLPRHHRPGLEHRPREHLARQGRALALARQAPAQPRRHDEPRRSPDGRRRRSHVRRPSPVLAVGPALEGAQDAQQQAHRRHDRQAPRAEGLREKRMPRSIKKGAVRRRSSRGEDRRGRRRAEQEGHQDVVAPQHDHAGRRRAHVRRAQRTEVRPGVRDGEHGRAQARRVRPDAHVPRPLRRQEGQGRKGGASAPPPAPRSNLSRSHTSLARARGLRVARARVLWSPYARSPFASASSASPSMRTVSQSRSSFAPSDS